MTDRIIDQEEEICSLSFADRSALAYATAAQILSNTPPSWSSLPLLSGEEHEALLVRIRGIADDMREAAGHRGLDLWRQVQ